MYQKNKWIKLNSCLNYQQCKDINLIHNVETYFQVIDISMILNILIDNTASLQLLQGD